MEDWYILYNSELPGYGFIACSVWPKEYSNVKLTNNLGPRQEIGFYKSKIPLEKCQPLRDILHKTGYTKLPPEPPMEPGTPTVSVGEGADGGAPVVKGFATTTLPPALVPFMDAIGPFIELVRKEPYQVLAGTAKWTQPAFGREADLLLQVTFSNTGVAPIEIQNPAAPPAGQEILVKLFLSRNTPNSDVQEFQLTRPNFRLLPPPKGTLPAKIPATLEILPGDQVSFEVRRPLRMLPGVYKAMIVFYSSQGPIDEKRAVIGALSIDPGLLTISK